MKLVRARELVNLFWGLQDETNRIEISFCSSPGRAILGGAGVL